MAPNLSPTERIRELNDAFRTSMRGLTTGKVLLTSGVRSNLTMFEQNRLMHQVMAFSAFTEDNDPHGEHDFGAIEQAGIRYFWKIDYYDRDCQYGSEDPADPEKTMRVLTIMRADEY